MKKILFLIFAILCIAISACKQAHQEQQTVQVQSIDTVKSYQIVETTVNISETTTRSTAENIMIVVAWIAILVFVIFTIRLLCNLEPDSYIIEDPDDYNDIASERYGKRKTCIIVMVITVLVAIVLFLCVFA